MTVEITMFIAVALMGIPMIIVPAVGKKTDFEKVSTKLKAIMLISVLLTAIAVSVANIVYFATANRFDGIGVMGAAVFTLAGGIGLWMIASFFAVIVEWFKGTEDFKGAVYGMTMMFALMIMLAQIVVAVFGFSQYVW